MKILVIGGAGYIGSHVVKEFMEYDHEIMVFDNFSTGLSQNLRSGNKFWKGDIRDFNDLCACFNGFRPDAVVHLAALKAPGTSMEKPELFSENNLIGTINILNCMVLFNVKYFIFSSSAAIFGSPKYLPIDENHPKEPENYYGFTKLEIERILDWYDRLKGIRFACLRYFNAAGYDVDGELYGLEQEPDNLIPRVMEAALGRRQLKIFGVDYLTRDGTCIRDYIHVSDLADAHVRALTHIVENDESIKVNLGTGKGTSIYELLDSARKITGKPIPAEEVGRRLGDPSELYATSKLAKELLGWKPKHSDIDTILETTWKAYLKNEENNDKGNEE